MMSKTLERGDVVSSEAGRDKGKLLVVVNVTENLIYVADGKERKLAKPKPKNAKHLKATEEKLSEQTMAADTRLRKALNRLQTNERSTGR